METRRNLKAAYFAYNSSSSSNNSNGFIAFGYPTMHCVSIGKPVVEHITAHHRITSSPPCAMERSSQLADSLAAGLDYQIGLDGMRKRIPYHIVRDRGYAESSDSLAERGRGCLRGFCCAATNTHSALADMHPSIRMSPIAHAVSRQITNQRAGNTIALSQFPKFNMDKSYET